MLDEKISLVVHENFALLDEKTHRMVYAMGDTAGELYSNSQGAFPLRMAWGASIIQMATHLSDCKIVEAIAENFRKHFLERF